MQRQQHKCKVCDQRADTQTSAVLTGLPLAPQKDNRTANAAHNGNSLVVERCTLRVPRTPASLHLAPPHNKPNNQRQPMIN